MKYILYTICLGLFFLFGCSNNKARSVGEQSVYMKVGDVIEIEGKRITLINRTEIYQRFASSSRLTKEEIMKLKDNKKTSPFGPYIFTLK